MFDDLANMIKADDRLLKALIALLALRDPTLLSDLQKIFSLAAEENNPIGLAGSGVWEHLEKEIAIITELVQSTDEFKERRRPN